MAFVAHRTRTLYPSNLYGKAGHKDLPCEESPESDACPDDHWDGGPHHIHLANGCTDHTPANCPSDHWIGGHPQVDHPHHVEYDGATGRWGYTRLSREEIADLAVLQEHAAELREQVETQMRTRIEVLRARADQDPAFRALAEHLGIPLEA